MLVGYVSDESYVALPDVLLEFDGEPGVFTARSVGQRRGSPRPAAGNLQGHASEAGLRRQAGTAVLDPTTALPASSASLPMACSATPGPSG